MNELKSRIQTVLENQEDGLTRAEIEALVGVEGSAQRVLRALRALKDEGTITFEGKTRERKYFPTRSHLGHRAGGGQSEAEAIPLSPEAVQVLRLISQPEQLRTPVSYQRSFLDDYIPNESAYLAPPVRERLRALGRTDATHAPAGTHARHILERLLIDLSWNSSRLEGNTYSLLDTERLLRTGTSAQGKSARETQMLLNHKAAIEFLAGEPSPAAVETATIKALHALLMENLLPESLDEGRLRSTPVQIGHSVYLPLANPQLLDECFRQLVHTASHIDDPFEGSFFLLVQLPYLQPFLDGNKRTARLAANIPLIAHNVVPLSFHEVPRELFLRAYLALYELNRVEPLRDLYLWAYERSAQRLGQLRSSLGEPDPFRLRYRTQLRELVKAVVQHNESAEQLGGAIAAYAQTHLPEAEHARFKSLVRDELANLHEGNFARYGLRPSEFEAWSTKRKSA